MENEIIVTDGGYFDQWMVSGWRYRPIGMNFYRKHPECIADLRRIVNDPWGALGTDVMTAMENIRERLPMDMFGLDFDVDRDGKVVVFETGATMAFLELVSPGMCIGQTEAPNDLRLKLRSRIETAAGSGNFHAILDTTSWSPNETAVIVCDMWDLHHCHNAVIRVGQLAPAMESLLNNVRNRGVTVIHAPSSCMGFYRDHPARKRSLETPVADKIPNDIGSWCSKIPSEDAGTYPIDQSDGGEDDDPVDHANWAEELADRGLNPKAPWTRQTAALTINPDKDYISDSGPEIWSILESEKIKNVILVGVHTNICVLGRPFGLRQMAQNGKNVVLMARQGEIWCLLTNL